MRSSKKLLTARVPKSTIQSPRDVETPTLDLRRGAHRVGLKTGANWQEHGLVSASSQGSPPNAHNVVNREFSRPCSAAPTYRKYAGMISATHVPSCYSVEA